MVQVWNVYTTKSAKSGYNPRGDVYIRRGRIGVKGSMSKNLSFKVWFAYDGLGKDPYSESTGGKNYETKASTIEEVYTFKDRNNNGKLDNLKELKKKKVKVQGQSNREFYIWDVIFTWKLNPEWANISIGYFRPQVGRESITTAFKVISFQKALTNFDLRKHLVGRGPGRETGINIGGLALNKKLNFNFGIFDTDNYSGKKWSPLFAARVAWSFGDPEHKKYKMGYTQSYYGKRNGITIGLNYAYQGQTDKFKNNGVYGVDLLTNLGPVDFNAEYDVLYRKNTAGKSGKATIWDVKAGYSIKLQKGQILRPSIMYSQEKKDSNNIVSNSSDKKMYEISLNWLIKKDKLKVNAAYNYEEVGSGSSKTKNSYVAVGLQFIY